MHNLNKIIVDNIVKECLNLYNKLPKTGKPFESEWTVLSCIIQYDVTNGNFDVVSLGTGSKCIGATKMSPKGDILHDSHAEVFARRGFLLYLYDNIDKAIENKLSIFNHLDGKFKLKDNLVFIFYSSQLPCGDASIMPKSNEEMFGNIVVTNKRPAEVDICQIKIKKQKVNDIHRTGAKCLPYSKQDPKDSDTSYHIVGQVRTKPGRGDRTLSVSCSDKIAKWIHLGIQGSLLDMLLYEPIFVKYFVFGAGVPYCDESINRAFLHRDHLTESLVAIVPQFYRSSIVFSDVRNDDKSRPAPGSIIWSKVNKRLPEVAVQGIKLGVTKKNLNTINNSLCISKYHLYKTFLDILSNHKELKQSVCGDQDISNISYSDMKKKSKRYLDNWHLVKETFFKTWTVKPEMWNFYIK